jgi:hypothetical protein
LNTTHYLSIRRVLHPQGLLLILQDLLSPLIAL